MPLFRIQHRVDTTANWESVNPILLNGEMGLEVKPDGTRLFKMGDGVMDAQGNVTGTAWIDLPYFSGPKGEDGKSPEYEWEGTQIRFKNPDGTWGDFVQLKGAKGDTGASGADAALVPATTTKLGAVIIGENLIVDETGCVKAIVPQPATVAPKDPAATAAVGTSLKYAREDHVHKKQVTITLSDIVKEITTPKSELSNSILDMLEERGIGGAGVGTANARLAITTSQTWTVPKTGDYTFSLVGGGGGGGGASITDRTNYCSGFSRRSGGGGGGGGAGYVSTISLRLNKDDSVNITIGAGGSGGSYGTNGTGGGKGGTTSILIVGTSESASANGGNGGGGGAWGSVDISTDTDGYSWWDCSLGNGGGGGAGVVNGSSGSSSGTGGAGGKNNAANIIDGINIVSYGIGGKGGNRDNSGEKGSDGVVLIDYYDRDKE